MLYTLNIYNDLIDLCQLFLSKTGKSTFMDFQMNDSEYQIGHWDSIG